jgi:hypothetical protein
VKDIKKKRDEEGNKKERYGKIGKRDKFIISINQ